MTPKFGCVKSFMDTDIFCKFSTKYGLDSEIVASFYESFATYVDLPKEKCTSRKGGNGPGRASPLVPVQSRTGTHGGIGPGL